MLGEVLAQTCGLVAPRQCPCGQEGTRLCRDCAALLAGPPRRVEDGCNALQLLTAARTTAREVDGTLLPAGVDHREPYADAELRTVVLAALAGLGPRQRAVVVLRHWHDLDVYETARALGCSVGTVKSQNARALAHLRRLLGPADDLLPVGGAR